jgi:tetratricopeptide (TPR) repeat protein
MPTTRVTGRGPKSPGDEEFLNQLYRGSELLAQGKAHEARQHLERAHQLQPRNEKSQNLLGLAYFKLGLFDRAAEVYEGLVRDNPVDATLRVNLGLVYLKTNALQRAMREFESATDLQPDHKKAHNYLGLALAQAGEYGRAREHFLQAGSDIMAEKMARAIAGDRFARPPRSVSAPVSTARPAPGGESQWGSQFGLDESPSDATPAGAEEELQLVEDEGPGAFAAAENVEAETEAAFAATSEAVSTSEALPEDSLENAAPELPAKVMDFRPGQNVPVLAELASAVALAGASEANPFRVGRGSFSVLVKGELLTRLEGLVAFSGQLQFEPEVRRFRGRPSEQSFGDGARQLARVTGEGVLYIESAEGRSFLAVDLGEEGAYLREEFLFAFEEAVVFENGKVPSDVAPDLELVHLRGQGRVLLSLTGRLRSVAVAEGAPVTVPLSHLVGWQGKVSPRMVPLLAVGSEPPRAAVELSGEGFALIVLPVR